MIKVEINSEDLQADLQRLARRLQQRKTLTAELSRILHHAVLDNFAAGGRPTWTPRKYPAKRNTALLQASGALRQSLTRSWDNNQAAVGTNLVYAAIHHFGGRTRPHTIRPKNGKMLPPTRTRLCVRKRLSAQCRRCRPLTRLVKFKKSSVLTVKSKNAAKNTFSPIPPYPNLSHLWQLPC